MARMTDKALINVALVTYAEEQEYWARRFREWAENVTPILSPVGQEAHDRYLLNAEDRADRARQARDLLEKRGA